MSFDAGGLLVLSYTNGTDAWDLRLPVCPFDASTLAYTGVGIKVPTEANISDTFAGFGAVWAPYFDSSWQLTAQAIFQTVAGEGVRLPTIPAFGAISGTSGVPSSSNPPIRRGFTFVDALGWRNRVRLFSVATDHVGPARQCTVNSGGFDARDQAVVAYLSGLATGLITFSGMPYPPIARVYERVLLRPFEPAAPVPPPSAALPTGRTGDILYHDQLSWVTLPIGQLGEDLQVEPVGQGLQPRWGPCCGADTTGPVPSTVIDTSGGGTTSTPGRTAAACGAASAMAAALEAVYRNIATAVDSVVSGGGKVAIATLITLIVSALTDGLDLPVLPWVEAAANVLAAVVVKLIPTSDLNPLDATQKSRILESIYCALPTGATSFVVTWTLIHAWQANIQGFGGLFTSGEVKLLVAILNLPVLAQWQAVATTGALSPSTDCSVFNCASGKALTGGALAGGSGKSLSGGGVYGTTTGHSLTGGAQHLYFSLNSLSGGVRT